MVKNIGDNSYGIYFIQCFWLIIINKLMNVLPISENLLPVYQFIQATFAILFSLVSIIVTNKILGKKISNRLLGF